MAAALLDTNAVSDLMRDHVQLKKRVASHPSELARRSTWIGGEKRRILRHEMETIVRQVRELAQNERSTIEQLVGHALRENQQLVIQVMTVSLPANGAPEGASDDTLPDWCKVYEGLSDEQVNQIENVALQRANLSRSAE